MTGRTGKYNGLLMKQQSLKVCKHNYLLFKSCCARYFVKMSVFNYIPNVVGMTHLTHYK